ncbi:hypothetical protein EDD85DRAFT_131680 [Armillaria nabsnona]|nr:hypothetical protein EDD85DRAFT_131680 [Armillaria nabsnona]
MYELLLRTFPNSSLVATNTESNHRNHIGAFCSLHFGIEYHYGRTFTVFNGLKKLANLLSPADTGLQSFGKQDCVLTTVADLKEVIAYTINFAVTVHWTGTRLAISDAKTVGILASGLLTILVDASCNASSGWTDTTGDSFYLLVNAAINVTHFIADQLGEPGRVSDEKLSKLLCMMGGLPASTDIEITNKKWYFRKFWAPTLFRYNGKSVLEMWADRKGLKASDAVIKLLAVFDSSLSTDVYDPRHPEDILMLYMLYGNQDQRCSVYCRGAKLADIAIEEYYTPAGARWWRERLTESEIGFVIHASIDELAPLNSTAPNGNYFAIICALLSVHTTDMEAMRKLGSLFESRIDACLSSSPSSNDMEVIHANIRSWSDTLVQILSNPETVDLRDGLIPKVLSSLIQYARSNYISGMKITDIFISSSAIALRLGYLSPCCDMLDDMEELMTLMGGSIEGDNDPQALKDARKRWKEVIDLPRVVPQPHLEDTYALLEKSIRTQ